MKRSPLVRKTPLKAKHTPTHRSGITRTTKGAKRKGRTPSETERAHGPEEFRAWMKTQPCIVPGCIAGPCDSAHVHSGGTGRKDDWTRTVPLCSTQPAFGYVGHHARYDNAKQSFPALHRLDMDAEASANHARWQAELSRRSA